MQLQMLNESIVLLTRAPRSLAHVFMLPSDQEDWSESNRGHSDILSCKVCSDLNLKLPWSKL